MIFLLMKLAVSKVWYKYEPHIINSVKKPVMKNHQRLRIFISVVVYRLLQVQPNRILPEDYFLIN